jgi:hypothetical protein
VYGFDATLLVEPGQFVTALLQLEVFIPQSTETLEAHCREPAFIDRFADGASGFLVMRAVSETTGGSEGIDVVEGFIKRVGAFPQLQLAHARCIDEQCPSWHGDQFSLGRGVSSARIANSDGTRTLALDAQ